MSTELMTLTPDLYPALDPSNERVKTLRENLAGEELALADLNRIRVPAGGGLKWQIENASGVEVLDALEGVILHIAKRRAYWSNPNPTNTPPDCASTDLLIGIGTPGGACKACPFYQFGSGKNGHGKACKETRIIFVLRRGQVLPDVLAVPPASLRALKTYLLRLSLPKYHVITQFTLEGAKNGDGIAYARIAFKAIGSLDLASIKAIGEMIRQYDATFRAIDVNFADIANDEPEEV